MRALAFDIGATHCRLALVSDTDFQTVITHGANASTDLDAAAQTIISSVHALAENVDTDSARLMALPAYIGAAGVIDNSVAEALKVRLPFKQVKIEEDRLNALRGSLDTRDGFTVHCGTGSFFARQRSGVAAFAGGWGPVLDDIASANWVGVQALQATLYAEDGLQRHTEMTSALLSKFGGAGGIVSYANSTDARDIGSIAQWVTEYAQRDDEAAVKVLQNGAAMITEKLSQFGCEQSDVICLTGGVATHYEAYLPASLQRCIVEPLGEPLDGAVALAREFYAVIKSS